MKLIFVCSAFQGKEKNLEKARAYCKLVMAEGHAPIAPHLLYPQFLDDSDSEQRRTGIKAGLEILKKCDELWYWGQPTSGMAMEIASACRLGLKIINNTSKS